MHELLILRISPQHLSFAFIKTTTSLAVSSDRPPFQGPFRSASFAGSCQVPRCCPGALRQGPSSSPETHLPPPFKHHVWCTQLEKTIRIPCPDFQVLHKPPSPGQLLLCAPSRDQLQGSTTTPPDPIQSLAHLREEPQSQEAWHRAPGSLSPTSCICSLTVLWKSGNWRDLCFVFFL